MVASKPGEAGFAVRDTHVLAAWYRERARPLLAEASSDALLGLDRAIPRLAPSDFVTELRFAVIGDGGVGKSTLLNALLFGTLPLLPRGGVGSVTARPIEVRWGATHSLHVRYSRTMLQRLIGNLSTESPQSREARNLAALLIKGNQYASVTPELLVDCVRACLGAERLPPGLNDPDRERILRVRQCLRHAWQQTDVAYRAGRDLPGLKQALDEHASGFLSPMTERIQIAWDTPMLRNGLVLIDLPGLGVAHDIHRVATTSVLTAAEAVLLVVDRSGLTETSVAALVNAGFFERAVRSALDRSCPPTELAIAITKLDLQASDALEFAAISGERTTPYWNGHFELCRERAVATIRGQLRDQLRRAARAFTCPDTAVDEVLGRAWIGAVTAREHVRMLRRRSHDPSGLEALQSAGVTELAVALAATSARCRTHVGRWLEQAIDDVAERGSPAAQRRAAEALRTELQRLLEVPRTDEETWRHDRSG